MTKPTSHTRLYVLLLTAAVLLWDGWLWLTGRETVSGAIGWAFSWPWVGWWVCGSFGFVAGHLLGMTDPAAPGYWWRCVAVPLAAAAVGFAITRWPL